MGAPVMPSPNWGLSIPRLLVSFYLGVGIMAFVFSRQRRRLTATSYRNRTFLQP